MSVGLPEMTAMAGAEVPRLLEAVEARLAEIAAGHGPELAALAGDTIAAGGKRLRPVLVGLSAGVPVPSAAPLLRSAVAVELVHAASLVHDDVLDQADLRRGRPTVVARAGRRAATATGDKLFASAFLELAAGGAAAPAAVQILSSACSQLAAGELLQREDAWRADVPVERYLERCRLKTAVLFRASCELGALTGGGERGSLGKFGEQIGVAFQILDDILDVTGPPERTGKPRGTDLLDGTVTLPALLARRADPRLARLDLRSVRTVEQADALCDRIAATGALDQARGRALRLVADAKQLLAGLAPGQRSALELVADGVVERYS